MSPPKKPCRTCKHYQRIHIGGPRTYGSCYLDPNPYRAKPAHANQTGCKHHIEASK